MQIDSHKLLTGIRFHLGASSPSRAAIGYSQSSRWEAPLEREEAPLLHRIRGLVEPSGLRLQRVHRTFSPQIVRRNVRSRSADDVQTVRDVVELVGEQVPVQVECHARRGVPKHCLLYT